MVTGIYAEENWLLRNVLLEAVANGPAAAARADLGKLFRLSSESIDRALAIMVVLDAADREFLYGSAFPDGWGALPAAGEGLPKIPAGWPRLGELAVFTLLPLFDGSDTGRAKFKSALLMAVDRKADVALAAAIRNQIAESKIRSSPVLRVDPPVRLVEFNNRRQWLLFLGVATVAGVVAGAVLLQFAPFWLATSLGVVGVVAATWRLPLRPSASAVAIASAALFFWTLDAFAVWAGAIGLVSLGGFAFWRLPPGNRRLVTAFLAARLRRKS